MKVLMLNGSSNLKGNTYTTLLEVGRQLEKEGIEYEIFQMGPAPVRDCIGCGKCSGEGCVFTDDCVNEFIAKAREADGFVFGTPVYYAHPSARILSLLDRAFYAAKDAFAFKPGAGFAIARRGGTTASFDVLNKYFTISSMVAVGSSYWNIAHGRTAGEVALDAEGMQTARNLARNMAWILKSIQCGRENGIALPETERGNTTNFIR